MHTFYSNVLITVSSTCFEHPSVHPQEYLYTNVKSVHFVGSYYIDPVIHFVTQLAINFSM
jgi:hypothetical protein